MGTEVKENAGVTSGGEVVLSIPNEEQTDENEMKKLKKNPSFTLNDFMHKQAKDPNLELKQVDSPTPTPQVPTFRAGSSSPEIITGFAPSPNRPPRAPSTLTRRPTRVSSFSKPKSRFDEPSGPAASSSKEENAGNVPIIMKTPSRAASEDEEEEEIYKIESVASKMEKKRKRFKTFVMVEWVVLVIIWGCLISSLTVNKLRDFMVWGLELWKWCVLVLVIVSGGLMTKWVVHVSVFLIEKNFLLKNKVLYFIYGVKKSVQVFIWVGLVLLTWVLLINRGVKRSRHATKILGFVSRALVSFLVGSIIWMVKTLLVKLLATNFQCSRFFDRIQESLFHQYVLQTLSGPPGMENAENIGRSTPSKREELSFRSTKKGKGDAEEVIDVSKLHKMNQHKVSAWTMKGLVNAITTTGLSTISNTLDQIGNERDEQKDDEITNEWEAKAAAIRIFKNVAKPGVKHIDVEDLLKFLNKTEVDNVLPLFEGASETGKIKKSALRNWVVKVYHDRKSLAHSLNDTKTAVKQLNNIISAIVIVVIIIVCLLIMGIATIQVFVFISSQMLVAAFVFGNTAKTIFESIIFVFVMHPFDVGDRCVIGGVQMIVEEMNILTTVFLRYDNEKIFYPNSVLATKPISNFYRSPDMGDTVDFTVDVSTTVESIGALKARIKRYIENKPQHWRPNHSVVVKEIENMNKMKMALYTTHTMNHQNFSEKNNRRTELVMEMKKIFEDLSIKYNLLPQEVHLSYVGSAATAPATLRH